MKSDKSFKDFLRSSPVLSLVAVGAVLAALLVALLLGGGASRAVASEESELEAVCSMLEGVGRCKTVVTYGEDGRVYAVAVLCDGAQSVDVRRGLTELLTSIYGIGANRIAVLKIE